MIFSKKKHEVGEIRYLRRFAFFPTDIDDGQYTVVWLRWYYEKVRYGEYGWDGRPYAWIKMQKMLNLPPK